MAQLKRIVEFLETLLEPQNYCDGSHNGLQVDAGIEEVITVAGAVDSGQSVIDSSLAQDADLLIVHHGLFWGNSPHVTNGFHGKKIRSLMQHPCSLFAAHLPLDGNLEVGNAAEILRLLNVAEVFPFGAEGSMTLGAQGVLPSELSVRAVAEKLSSIEGYGPEIVLPFGAQTVRTIGVCTGAGGFAIDEAARLGLDLLISGEPKQSVYHQAKELEQSVLFIGHYASETFGVKAVLNVLEHTFGVKTAWISEPTGI